MFPLAWRGSPEAERRSQVGSAKVGRQPSETTHGGACRKMGAGHAAAARRFPDPVHYCYHPRDVARAAVANRRIAAGSDCRWIRLLLGQDCRWVERDSGWPDLRMEGTVAHDRSGILLGASDGFSASVDNRPKHAGRLRRPRRRPGARAPATVGRRTSLAGRPWVSPLASTSAPARRPRPG